MEMTRRNKAGAAFLGAIVGFVLGVTSAGSGALIAVGLILLFRLVPTRVVGTDVFHAAILLWAAATAHLVAGNVDFGLAANILLGSLPGVWIGHEPVGEGAHRRAAHDARAGADRLGPRAAEQGGGGGARRGARRVPGRGGRADPLRDRPRQAPGTLSAAGPARRRSEAAARLPLQSGSRTQPAAHAPAAQAARRSAGRGCAAARSRPARTRHAHHAWLRALAEAANAPAHAHAGHVGDARQPQRPRAAEAVASRRAARRPGTTLRASSATSASVRRHRARPRARAARARPARPGCRRASSAPARWAPGACRGSATCVRPRRPGSARTPASAQPRGIRRQRRVAHAAAPPAGAPAAAGPPRCAPPRSGCAGRPRPPPAARARRAAARARRRAPPATPATAGRAR